ncbi:hypothetical protein [Litorihabitans aurantiacus]|uniref:Uncharacterized protein n=1 Tax=Litorihabitans aurantiacus TaxID=1930061 RepID=A0AA37XI02_9MICO|nr:hypothetical protein [Litorihabitans aurantiacus]GMA33379.1 hypothetical protein GCM10025875_33710 [Litorihabitans aurantiacus]
MSTLHLSDHTTTSQPGLTETEAAAHAVGDAVAHVLAGTLPGGVAALRHPLPIAFLDDGRRLVLVIDAGRGRAADRPRSWGVEVVSDGDLVGGSGGDGGGQTAVRSTRRLTPAAAVDAARFVLAAGR